MCLKRYQTVKRSLEIRVVKADRETDHSLYVNGRRRAKRGQWDNYFHTFNDAKLFIVKKAMHSVKWNQIRLTEAETFLHKAQGIREDPRTH